MKRILFTAPLLLVIAFLAPAASAQVTVGVYGDYTRLAETSTNMTGLGARVGVKVFPMTSLEAQMTYDFDQAFTEKFTNTTGGVFVNNSNMKILKGLFGPTFETPGPVKLFVTAKGGFINFSFNAAPGSVSGFTSSVSDLRTNNIHGMFYPGGGLMAYIGPVGLRLEVGDDMYFANGAHNNLVVQFGPTIRF
ncbi:MAG TPA: hypothetical protein VNK23_06655 [Candidatus Dormibacteraeota bacterium]|nr:hypothetical protein [Candidatus Dormibacteraeota bacterium]